MTRVAGDPPRQCLRFRLERFVGADLLYQAPFQRFCGIDSVTGKGHQTGFRDADDAR
ncbi:hypothetical protein D3C87_1888560 [compost metagenome]